MPFYTAASMFIFSAGANALPSPWESTSTHRFITASLGGQRCRLNIIPFDFR
jgi:hypothetical protein